MKQQTTHCCRLVWLLIPVQELDGEKTSDMTHRAVGIFFNGLAQKAHIRWLVSRTQEKTYNEVFFDVLETCNCQIWKQMTCKNERCTEFWAFSIALIFQKTVRIRSISGEDWVRITWVWHQRQTRSYMQAQHPKHRWPNVREERPDLEDWAYAR